MRVLWKFSVIVLLGVLTQVGLVHAANDIDEAVFVARVFFANQRGIRFDDPELLQAADRLFARQCQRLIDNASSQPMPRRVEVASSCTPVDDF